MKSRASALLLLAALACRAPQAARTPALVHAEAIRVDATIPEDPAVVAFLAPYQARMKAEFSRELCQAPQGLFRGGKADPPGENPMGSWIADVMRQRASVLLGRPVQAALTNSGGIRANFRPGAVTVGSIFEVAPFENELVVVEVTGAQLARMIRQGLERRAGEPCSGIKATLKGTAERPEFEMHWSDGRPVDPAETLLLATNDYLAANGDTMPAAAKAGRLTDTGLTIRQMLMDACETLGKAGQPLTAPADPRYIVAPELAPLLKAQKLKLGEQP
ncbi:MAG TPA: 5'-nucleotidase C-terminal domain-containing protein [Holophagaceae bacterium]|nr:5'-nucleotidase C-terminal domain-containing protein [Holophagaceae bacterium]